MTRRFNQIGMVAACVSLVFLAACGDTNDNDGDILANTLVPEVEGIVVNPPTAEPLEVQATVTRSEQISRTDARAIATVMLNNIYLPDQAFETEIRDLKVFSPHVQVRELPSFENDNLYRIQRVFSAQGYICRPDENQFNQYVNVVCVRADAAEEQQQQQQ